MSSTCKHQLFLSDRCLVVARGKRHTGSGLLQILAWNVAAAEFLMHCLVLYKFRCVHGQMANLFLLECKRLTKEYFIIAVGLYHTSVILKRIVAILLSDRVFFQHKIVFHLLLELMTNLLWAVDN